MEIFRTKNKETEKEIIVANINYHDEIANQYVSGSVFDERNQNRIKKIFENLNLYGYKKKKKIDLLDIGCGTGNVLKIVEPYFQNLYGVDVSINMLRKSRVYCPSAELFRAEGNRLPFKSNSFDCVSLFSVLHHVHNIDPLLEEIYRIMKNGGILYTDNDPNSYFILRKLSFIRDLFKPSYNKEKIAEYHKFTGGLNPLLIEAKLKSIGFSDIKLNFRSPVYIAKSKFFVKLYLLTLNYFGCLHPKLFSHYFWIIASKKIE